MEIRPIFSAMMRNRSGVLLVGLQIAITLAVAANAAFIIQQRLEKIGRPSGVDSANMFYIHSYGYSPSYDSKATLRADLDKLRRLPGVTAVSSINAMLLSGGGSANSYQVAPNPKSPQIPGNYFEVGEQGLNSLGVKLVAGRNFRADELTYSGLDNQFPKQIMMTRTMAKALFGNENGVGKLVYNPNGNAAEIIGVTENMMGSWVDSRHPENVVFHPILQDGARHVYVVRTQPGRRDELMMTVEKTLSAPGDGRFVVWVHSQDRYIQESYRSDHRMVVFLWTLISLMVGVTALGIVGLATFLVNARRKQIGTRRAIGARRIDIVRYFMIENGMLTLFGVIVGAGLSFIFSYWLSNMYALPPLKAGFVLWGIAALLALGQLAVFVPARRAAAVPPAVATRTV